jgi:nucleoside phosphorylase
MHQFILLLSYFLLTCLQAHASTIALFHALDEDLSSLKREGATQVRSFSVGDTSVSQLTIAGHTIYAVKMGSGCVQTCVSAQALLAKQKCDLAMSLGPVGDIKGTLDKKMWYRVNEVTAWQRGTQGDTGYVPQREARQTLALPQGNPQASETYATMPAISVASGEVFVASDSFRAELASLTKCDAVDMNLFGLLAVLQSHKIEGIHLRIPSDNADNNASDDFRRFTENYKGEGGKIVAKIIRALPEDRTSPAAHNALRKLLNDPQTVQPRGEAEQSEKVKGGSANPVDAKSQQDR